ncbi:sensor histidine kinase [Kitasatospora sp. NBC_01266]|uniref:sensor histidine kinase n=1 Tax=Kitasatospora sp. NBC_01266 TaxID=2903572 RepID=UPI002E34EA5A|nr:HAMP domain-containing sensor histidine kinase [Kitasatospora sp. NBC_01266]
MRLLTIENAGRPPTADRPPRWWRRRPGIRARAALAALVAAALAFGLATVWVGRSLHADLELQATDRAESAVANIEGKIPDSPDEPYATSSYVVMDADGLWLRSGADFSWPPGWAREGLLPPVPPADYDQVSPATEEVIIRMPSFVPGMQSGWLSGRTVRFRRSISDSLSSADLAKYTGVTGMRPQTLTIYVLVDDEEADRTSATVARILGWYLTPGASLFVALIAWLVTGLALRPVEAIRRRMAEIGDGAIHQRVPVPTTRDTINRLARTTNHTLDRLEHALDEQRRLVADASHELRSPLAALRTSLEIPLAHPDHAHWPTVVTNALTDTARLQELADDLLLLARTQETHTQETHTPTDSTVALHDIVAEQLAERTVTDPTLNWHGHLTEATVPGHEVLIGRLVRNLLDNAARHTTDTITATLHTTDGWAELTITDNGPGIPPADRERVFDRFVRLDTARNRATGGAGLGLALVRTIATTLGGTATATQPPTPPGAHLLIRLPLAR